MGTLFDISTNKQGLIVYGGEASSDFGMVVAEAPTFEQPQRKQTAFSIPGRNGAVLFQQDAWEDVTRAYRVYALPSALKRIDEVVGEITSWLNSKTGYQRLTDNFEPDVFRLAYYSGGNDFTNEMTQFGESTLTFTCRAERFLLSGETAKTVVNGDTIKNDTKFTAKPLIHIEGTGTVTFSIGAKTITASLTDYINIDCESMDAYRLPAENKNGDISGTFPTLAPGTNTIAITGTVTKATVTPRFFII